MIDTWARAALNVVRGGLIGTVEVVPGVSGGTVALIVGIYETIITSAGHVLSGLRLAVVDLPRGRGSGRARQEFARADWATVLPVAAGMLAAIVLVARYIEDFVRDEPELARGLFLGLVLASVLVPISMVGRHWQPSYVLAAVVAALLTFFITGLPPTEVAPSPPIVLLAASIAVCALVLPGVSGAFILLTIGLYEPTLAALNDRDFGYIGWFVLGAAVGLAVFVKTLQWLLEHRRHVTLAVLTGLMAGATRALWPWQEDDRTLLAPGDNLGTVALLFAVGVTAVLAVLVLLGRTRRTTGAHARPRSSRSRR